jgi:hypothetical protein
MFLLQARAKLDRANVHIGKIERCVVALEDTDRSVVKIRPDTGTEQLCHTLDESAFEQIALLLGDAIHNLNCVLDYTWLQTIEILAPSFVSRYAKFPIYQSSKELEGQLRERHIDTICSALFDLMIDEIKPHDGGNAAIWPVHCFANRDKHRLLIPTLAEVSIKGIEVQDETGDIYPASGMSAPQKPPYCIDVHKGTHFTKNGKLTANVIVEDGKFGCLMDIPHTLVVYHGIIVGVVEAFESLLEAQGF